MSSMSRSDPLDGSAAVWRPIWGAARRTATGVSRGHEPVLVRLASLVGAIGIVVTAAVAAFGLPGPVRGLMWDTSTRAGDYNVTIKVVAVVAGLFVAILALGRFELSRSERRQAASALDYSEQTLYEGQYVRAVAQLASVEAMVQLGGVYSLDLLYRESLRHRSLAVRALCAFVRSSCAVARDQPDSTRSRPEAAVAAIGVLREFDGLPIGLELTETALDFVSLDGTRMEASDLGGASLRHATITYGDLTWSNLRGCDLSSADVSSASFDWCNLSGARLHEARIGGASFCNADLTNVDFTGTNLDRADLTDATWPVDSPPTWPAGFAPPPARAAMTFEELDAVRRAYVAAQGARGDHPGLRFSGAALRQHDMHYRRLLSMTAPVDPDPATQPEASGI